MLRAKKAKEEATAAAAAAAATASADGSTGGDAGAGSAAPKMSLLGGDEKKSTGAPLKKVKPSELRVTKDLAELDAGKVGKMDFPFLPDQTRMRLTVTPDSGLWSGGAQFIFSITIPDGYPHEPPKVLCETKIYHPNIDLEGHVCLNILRDGWKPIYDINTVCYGLCFLFYDPNPLDPLNHEAAQLMRDNRAAFESNVRSSLRGGTLRIQLKDGSYNTVTFPKLL